MVVGFRGHHVLVESDEKPVVRYIGESFRSLRPAGPVLSRETFQVRRAGDEFELTLDGERVFAHRDTREVARFLRHEIIDSFVRTHAELLWVHAGAAVLGGRALLFVGRFGRGKSTLVTRLCRRGWTYLSDDILPIDLATGEAIPFPLTPAVREGIGSELPNERISELRKLKVTLPRDSFHRGPVPIGGIVLPAYTAGVEARSDPYSPAAVTLDLVREGINKQMMPGEAVALCARLVNEVPVLAISYSDPDAATDLIVRSLGWNAQPSRTRPVDATRDPSSPSKTRTRTAPDSSPRGRRSAPPDPAAGSTVLP